MYQQTEQRDAGRAAAHTNNCRSRHIHIHAHTHAHASDRSNTSSRDRTSAHTLCTFIDPFTLIVKTNTDCFCEFMCFHGFLYQRVLLTASSLKCQ